MNTARKRGPSYIGTVLGEKYRLEGPIGEGGMATVWAARHLALHAPVAVKFLHVDGEADAVRDRFLREARVAAAINHRNVVDIIDFGTTDDGRPYMVMEYLDGETLRERLDRGSTLSVPETVRLCSRMLSGLAAVHEAGIVHRDIKPGNLFLVNDSDEIYPKLLDFGVSRSIGEDVESVMPSRENVIMGTPHYMSPEQARGVSGIDSRADIYAMGVVLYEMLSGRLPFECPQMGDLIVMIITGNAVPLKTLRPDLGDPLVQVVNRAIEREPANRFQTAREMRQALLEAATRMAAEMSDGGRMMNDALGLSGFPMAQPEDLIDAVTQSREPGDSGLIRSSFPPPVVDEVTPLPSPRLRPPPVPRMTSQMETLDEVLVEPIEEPPSPPPVPSDAARPRRRRWPIVALLFSAAVGAGVLWVQPNLGPRGEDVPVPEAARAPDPEAVPQAVPAPAEVGAAEPEATEAAPAEARTVTVALRGVPEGAVVHVDGEEREGSTVELPREEVAHEITVTADGRAPWQVSHLATADGSYEVEMAAVERPAENIRADRDRRRRLRRIQARRRARETRMIFTDPGF